MKSTLTFYVKIESDGPLFWNRLEETIKVALQDAGYDVSEVSGIDEDHDDV